MVAGEARSGKGQACARACALVWLCHRAVCSARNLRGVPYRTHFDGAHIRPAVGCCRKRSRTYALYARTVSSYAHTSFRSCSYGHDGTGTKRVLCGCGVGYEQADSRAGLPTGLPMRARCA